MSMSALMTALRDAGRKQLSASTLSGPRKATGSHVFRIGDYTKVRDKVGNGTAVNSSTFRIGGHDWQIQCYPNGYEKEDKDWISVYLRLATTNLAGDAKASYKLSILDQAAGKPLHTCRSPEQRCFSSGGGVDWGWRRFMEHADLREGKHLQGGSLTLLCDVTVDLRLELDGAAVPVPVSEPAPVAPPPPPPPPPPFDLHGQLEETFWDSHEPDMVIEVAGGTFPVHRAVLEAKSPVFKEDLLALISSATGDKSTLVLRIDDMNDYVCKLLLQYIYTESAPEADQLLDRSMAERLLAAADRYKLEKLKKICEEALCENIDMGSVAATLALAERHGCSVLKDACIRLLSASGNLEAVMATDGFEQLKTEYPSVLLEIALKKIAGEEQ